MNILPNTIITFHEIQNPIWLDRIIESLKNNYHIIRTEELEDYYYNNKKLKNACHITFDDGDISFYNNTLPLIKKHDIPVSTYVSPLVAKEKKNFWFQEIRGYNEEKLVEIIRKVTGNTNIQLATIKPFLKTLQIEVIWKIIRLYQQETNTSPKPPMNMTEKQLLEVKSSGLVDIGAHTLNHPILINETDESAANEIIGSIDQLSDVLNCEIKYFVYPNGDYGEREMNILRSKGARLAFSTKRDKISYENNPLCIPRSGSPFVSEYKNNQAYIYSKCFLQQLVGEKRYYKYSDSWNSMAKKKSHHQISN